MSSSLSPELAFLLQAAGSAAPAPQPADIDWPQLVRLAQYHRLYPRISPGNVVALPAAQASALLALMQSNAVAALHNLRRTAEVVQRLRAQRVEPIVLKGPLLAHALYGDIAARVAGDVDLLVPEQQLLDACHALVAAGYQPEKTITREQLRRTRRYQHDIGFAHPEDGTLIELHADIAQPHYGYRLDLAGWFGAARTIAVGGELVQELDHRHRYLLIALHASKHRWHRLDLLSDIAACNRQGMHAGMFENELPGWLLSILRFGEELADFFWRTGRSQSGRVSKAASQIIAGEEYGRVGGLMFDLGLRHWPANGGYLARRAASAVLRSSRS